MFPKKLTRIARAPHADPLLPIQTDGPFVHDTLNHKLGKKPGIPRMPKMPRRF